MLKKIFRGFLWTVLAGAVIVVVLVKGFGLRLELYGNGMKPHLYFFKPDVHYAEIEKSRMAQRAAAPEPEVAAVSAPAANLAAATPSAPSSGGASPAAETTGGAMPAGGSMPATATMPATAAAAGKSLTAPSYWTSFRGPNRDGVYSETPVLASWPSDGLKPLWKQPVGGGYASFVVGGGRAFTIEQRRDQEVVAAYSVKSGREVWAASWPAQFQEALGGNGPRATPAFDDGRVYALGATGEFRCLDAATGKVIWSRNILTDNGAANLTWGVSGSPLVVDGKVIVQPGGASGKSVVAYDKLTGKPVWTSLDDKQSYSSPELETIAGVRQIVVVSATRVAGLKIEDGSLLWQYPWHTDPETNSTQPVFLEDHADSRRLFLSSGYNHGATVLDVTRTGDAFAVKMIWENKKMKTRFNTAVYYKGYLYGLDEGILACIDAATGELKWKGGRYGYGQLLLASGELIVLTEQGELVLVKASPDKLEEVSRFEAIDGKTWNYPAIDNGVLLVRNANEMAAFRIN